MPDTTKYVLSEDHMPAHWLNVLPLLKEPMDPPLHPGTKKPLNPEDLAPIFPMSLIEQEMSMQKEIDIPGEVIDILRLWRPSPLYRARRLEKLLDTPAHIYYKYEGVSPAGSHKPNTSIPQAYYNKKAGIKRIATETGAGQWGSALSLACNFFEMDCTVYMVKISYQQKPYRRSMIQSWGGEIYASPTDRTNSGRAVLEKDPDTPGSLGIAISEAVEDAATHDDTNYSLGSVLNHVCTHQTVIGLECKKQFELAGEEPDVVVGCFGGGSNFAGIALPYLEDRMNGSGIRLVAVEPAACPTLTKGAFEYDFGDVAGLTPLMRMYTLGHAFVPPKIHSGGLRYHGAAPLCSHLLKHGWLEAKAYMQLEVFEASMQFARTEGIIPAPESSHAIKGAIDEALQAKEEGKKRVVVFNLSGHGHFDMSSYESYLAGKLENFGFEPELKK